MTKIYLIISIIALSMYPAYAATYHIDPSCSTSGNGTTTSCGPNGPFKTWAEVKWAAGNTYLQKGGTTAYETIVLTSSGNTDQLITIGSYGAGKAILNGSIPANAGWIGPDENGVYKMRGNRHYFLLENDTFVKFATTKSNLNKDGNYFEWHRARDGYNYYKPAGNFNANMLYQVRSFGIQLGKHDHIIIKNIAFTKYWFCIYSAPNEGDANTHITITNCEFSNSQQGIGLKANNAHASHIKIMHNTFDFIKGNIEFYESALNQNKTNEFRNCEIANNTITHSGQVYTPTGPADYTWEEIDMSYGHGYTGVDLEGVGTQNLADSSIHDNYISGVGHGIVLYSGKYNKSYNNLIYNNYISLTGVRAIGISFEPHDLSKGFYQNKAHNNVIISAAHGFRIKNIIQPIKVYNCIYNNTIAYGKGSVGHGLYAAYPLPASADYFDIRNNIFIGDGTSNDGAAIYFLYANNHDNVVIDYNLFYPQTGAAGKSRWYNAGYKSWMTWKSFGYDSHSLYAVDNKFTPAFNKGFYTLSANSPAIDAGTNVGIKKDFNGITIPQCAGYDIGAYEYNGLCK